MEWAGKGPPFCYETLIWLALCPVGTAACATHTQAMKFMIWQDLLSFCDFDSAITPNRARCVPLRSAL